MENRTVFDTNIWISYMITAKYNELESMVTNNIHFLRSAPSLAELQEVLSRKKFQKYNVDVDKTIVFYINLTEFCETKPTFEDCSDPKDNFLFDLAIQGKANYLVSGDKKVYGSVSGSQVKFLLAYSTEIGGKVITRISVHPLTVSDNPNGVQSRPNFAKPPGRCVQAGRQRC